MEVRADNEGHKHEDSSTVFGASETPPWLPHPTPPSSHSSNVLSSCDCRSHWRASMETGPEPAGYAAVGGFFHWCQSRNADSSHPHTQSHTLLDECSNHGVLAGLPTSEMFRGHRITLCTDSRGTVSPVVPNISFFFCFVSFSIPVEFIVH